MSTRSTGRCRRHLPRLLAALLVVGLGSPELAAETFPVAPGESIQDAVDAAGPADQVTLSAGVYRQVVDVPAGKDGLAIVGKGKVILDALDAGEGTVPGLAIGSSDVLVRNLTIRHAAGIGLMASGMGLSGIQLDKVTVLNATGDSIVLEADQVLVQKCTVRGSKGRGLVITGNNALVTRNTFQQVDVDAVVIDGDDAEVSRNTIREVNNDNGVDIVGSFARVLQNTISRTDDNAITITGANALVDKNTVASAANDDAIQVIGDNPTATANKVSAILNGHAALMIVSTGSGGLVERNTVRDCVGAGIEINGDSMTVNKNKVTDCGVERVGIQITGDMNTVLANTLKGIHQDGISVLGNANQIERNKVTDGFEDGVALMSGTANVLDGNTIRNNQSEGVDNTATNTTLRNNKISKNRIDVANGTSGGATIVIEDNNKIGDGSDGTDEPEV